MEIINYKISFCIICMNRLEQLKQTLIRNLTDNESYEHLEVVLLDYNSQDDLEVWVKENMMQYLESGRMVYYKTLEPTAFNHSHSKNLAFKIAAGDIVCNINADHFAGRDFAKYINRQFALNEDIVITPIIPFSADSKGILRDVLGKVCVTKKAFLHIRGFDERMLTYGYEDGDLINRLEMTAIKRYVLKEPHFLEFLAHPDEQRFSVEKACEDMDHIFVHHINPWTSNLVVTYTTGKFEMCHIVDQSQEHADDYQFSYKKRSFDKEYRISAESWITGSWEMRDDGLNFDFRRLEIESFSLCFNNDHYTAKLNGQPLKFFILQDSEARRQLLECYFLLKNKCLRDLNLLTQTFRPNENGFGEATLYRNFDMNTPIVV